MLLIEKGKYFTINRPRQYGKTTTISHLEKALRKNPDYLVSSISFEGIGVEAYQNSEVFITSLLGLLNKQFKFQNKLNYINFIEEHIEVKNFSQLSSFIADLVSIENTKIILIIDEVDKSMNNQIFIDFLGMLRNKYLLMNDGKDFTFHSVVLSGVHDVKNLKIKLRPDEERKFNSPWNIATEFKVDMSFNPQEISTMLVDYVQDKNVGMNIPEISERIYYFTSGYPFLVSRICKEIDEVILPEKKEQKWDVSDIDNAVKIIVDERNTNFESLVTNLENNAEIFRFMEDLIIGSSAYLYNALDPVIQLCELYGFIKPEARKIVIHNKIYNEVVSNYIISRLTREKSKEMAEEAVRSQFVFPSGKLNLEKVLLKFQEVIKEKYSKSDVLKSNEFLEKDLRLLFLVFLKPIINGIGFSFKEVETSEEKRLDIVVIFKDEKFIVELKLWRGEEYHKQGIIRLKEYMCREGAEKGYMLIMDKNRSKEFVCYEEEGISMVWI